MNFVISKARDIGGTTYSALYYPERNQYAYRAVGCTGFPGPAPDKNGSLPADYLKIETNGKEEYEQMLDINKELQSNYYINTYKRGISVAKKPFLDLIMQAKKNKEEHYGKMVPLYKDLVKLGYTGDLDDCIVYPEECIEKKEWYDEVMEGDCYACFTIFFHQETPLFRELSNRGYKLHVY